MTIFLGCLFFKYCEKNKGDYKINVRIVKDNP